MAQSESVLGAVDTTGDAEDALARLLDATWEVTHRYGALVVAAEQVLPAEQLRQAHHEPMLRVQQLIRRGRRQGSFRKDMPVTWQLSTIQAIVHGASAAVHRGEVTAAQAPALIRGTVLASTRAPPAVNRADDLAVQDGEPAALGVGPLPPGGRHLAEALLGGDAVVDGLAGEVGLEDAPRPAPPQNSRSSGVANSHTLADGRTSANPASRAQDTSRRPASGSAPLARETCTVRREPVGEAGQLGEPGHRAVVGLPDGDDAVRDGRPGPSRAAPRPGPRGGASPGARGPRRSSRPGSRAPWRRRARTRRRPPARCAAARANCSASSAYSTPTTRPGATSRFISMVMLPGPLPTSSRSIPGTSRSRRYAAESSTPRRACVGRDGVVVAVGVARFIRR